MMGELSYVLVDGYIIKLCRYNKFHIHTEDILVLKLVLMDGGN